MPSANPLPSATTLHPSARGPRLLWMCVVLALIAWIPTAVRGGWALDDREVLERNPVVSGSVPWTEAFRRDYWEHVSPAGHFRPTASLTLRVDHAFYGEDSRGFHATNVLLHALVVLALGALLLVIGSGAGFGSGHFPWIGLGVFAVHPSLADSVAWISGRTSMLCALGGLIGALAIANWTTPWRDESRIRASKVACAAALGSCLALLGKEDGIIFGGLYVLLGGAHSKRAMLGAFVGSAVGVATYLALRGAAFGSPWPSADFAPLADRTLWERLLVGGRAFTEGLRLAVLPVDYPPLYERSSIFAASSRELVPLGLAGLAVLTSACIVGASVAWRRRKSRPAWSLVLAALATLPMLQLIPAGALFAPRFLYLPLLLLVPFVDALFRRIAGSRAHVVASATLVLAVLGAWRRGVVYSSPFAFYSTLLAFEPNDAAAYNQIGLAHENEDRIDDARAAFVRATELDPTYGRPWSNLGRLELTSGDMRSAEHAFRRAVELGRGNPVARVNLAIVLQRTDRASEALVELERACQLAPGLVPAWRARARAEQALGRLDDARKSIRRALELDPRDADSLRIAGELEDR